MAEDGGIQTESPVSGTESPKMEEPPALGGNWSELPYDILSVIQGELEFPDLFRSAAVCTSWRAAARSLLGQGHYSRAQTPCLLYTTGAGARAAQLYNLADKTTYTVPLPDPPIGDRHIIGSSHGWLVTADARSELHLLNPATGDQIALPSVTTIEQVRPLSDDAGSLEKYEYFYYNGNLRSKDLLSTSATYPLDSFRQYLHHKAILSSDPSRGDSFTVMLIHEPDYQLSFARSGDTQWNWVKFKNNNRFADCIYHDGVFYASTFHGAIHAIVVSGDSFTQRLLVKNPMAKIWNVYIVRTQEGEILQVLRITEDEKGVEPRVLRTAEFDVYKADYEKPGVEPVDDLGDNALFVGTSYSSCLSVKDHPQLLPNHIYFDDDNEYWLLQKDGRRDVGAYHYVNDTVDDLASPQPWPNWPPPVWITPSFTKMLK